MDPAARQGSPPEHGFERTLKTLSAWASDEHLRLNQDFSLTDVSKRGLFARIARIWRVWREAGNHYVHLQGFLRSIQAEVKKLPPDSPEVTEIREKLQRIYARIGREWYREKDATSVYEMVDASDLLEAYNTAFAGLPGLGVRRLSLYPPAESARANAAAQGPLRALASLGEKTILLAEYQKLEEIISIIKEGERAGKPLTRKQVEDLVQGRHLSIEKAPAGKMIDALYRRKFAGRHELEKVLTLGVGWLHNSTKLRGVFSTVRFFKNLHIDLWMEIGGEVHSFSELFGYSLREAKSRNASFTRALTDEARAKFFEESGYQKARQRVQQQLGDPNAQVVCANAFSRVTMDSFTEGAVDVPRTIREKTISPDPENLLLSEAWGAKSRFTIHDMLGGYPLEQEDADLQTDAQRQAALLAHTAKMVDGRRGMMVIQRLSPSDVHHFSTTADCDDLTYSEWCQALRGMIEERQRLGIADEGDQKELEQLERLKAYFSQQAAASSTINIAGDTLASVSTPALRHEPGILATNDRKIRLVRHKDGTLAVHAYIGASAVNQVIVPDGASDTKVMSPVGFMGFGPAEGDNWISPRIPEEVKRVRVAMPETVLAASSFFAFIKRAIQSILLSLGFVAQKRFEKPVVPPTSIAIDSEGGAFGPGGSTVVSLYFGYRPLESLETPIFREIQSNTNRSETIEVKCRPGNVLAVPTLSRTIDLMEKLEVSLAEQRPPLEVLTEFYARLQGLESPPPIAQEWLGILREASPLDRLQDVVQRAQGYENRSMLSDLIAFLDKR